MITLPDPTTFTAAMLAKRWGCLVDTINSYVRNGTLKAEVREFNGPRWMAGDLQYFTLEEVLRFEKEACKQNVADDKSTIPIKPYPITPHNELLKRLVLIAVSRLYKEGGKFPQYMQVLNKLRIMAKSDDQAGRIIEYIDMKQKKGVKIHGRDEHIAVSTIQNWMTAIKKDMKANNPAK